MSTTNFVRFNFVNTDKLCRKKPKSPEKDFNSLVFDQVISAGNNLLKVKLLTNLNFVNFLKKVLFGKAFNFIT